MTQFKIISDYKMMGDQGQAVEKLAAGVSDGKKYQTLMGVTGSGKTFTMANIIEKVQKPTLIISHNKTLAAQLYGEFKEFFPGNAVEYFVSYYDYYQPEAYVASTDTYIEKDSDINEEIEKLRHSATAALSERSDVIIVASVSCIYGLGSPIDYENQVLSMRPGMIKDRDEILRKLVDIQYTRNDIEFIRSTFRVRGDIIDIYPVGSESAVRVELFGDEIESIKEINPITGEIFGRREHISIFPASHVLETGGMYASEDAAYRHAEVLQHRPFGKEWDVMMRKHAKRFGGMLSVLLVLAAAVVLGTGLTADAAEFGFHYKSSAGQEGYVTSVKDTTTSISLMRGVRCGASGS